VEVVRRIALPLLFAAAPLFAALPAEELRRGLLNLIYIEDIAFRLQYQRAVHGTVAGIPGEPPADPWGTPYRIEIAGNEFRVIGAGSDRRFDEPTWSSHGQFADLTFDVINDDGKTVRSNYTWLNRMVPDRMQHQDAVMKALLANPGKPVEVALTTPQLAAAYLLSVEGNSMMLRNPLTLDVLRAEITQGTMAAFAAQVTAETSFRPGDEWGTPLRAEFESDGSVRVISAGADRKFDPQSWSAAMKHVPSDDQVYVRGKGFVRRLDRAAFARQTLAERAAREPAAAAAAAPRTVDRGGVKALLVGGDVKPPVVTKRVDPVYPKEMRAEKKVGLSIVEVVIDETGKLRDVKMLLSRAPAFDRAIEEALAQWEFQPGTLNGKPVPVLYNMTIQFNLDE
jgi:TonB family protein